MNAPNSPKQSKDVDSSLPKAGVITHKGKRYYSIEAIKSIYNSQAKKNSINFDCRCDYV